MERGQAEWPVKYCCDCCFSGCLEMFVFFFVLFVICLRSVFLIVIKTAFKLNEELLRYAVASRRLYSSICSRLCERLVSVWFSYGCLMS